ncbi:DNA mismatch repair endonuclease MutL [Psychrosphaera aestuarii]|uniref:DNA mismatch repair endonuclease MutL n=1 Tax=Psychrosphaera aestuarii TaxID=1266052 RepID=UPI001B31B546|nr:DNA mismatch repair endonuclease MutL [Psychrosphaera aestuarii]
MTIKILPPQLANQIAAGEVVERPASVVKELVENALDAGADKVEIDIERGGHKKILIKDNGKGIPKQELALALSRHATSKITNIDDLEAIVSLGFRGEALASISSVARLTMTSKPVSQPEAWSAIAEGLDMQVDVKPAAHPNGTSVEVLDLFFNTPARRKFLRAEKTEFNHIEGLIRRIAMSRPDVTFVLQHNNKVVKRFRSQAANTNAIKQQSARIAEVINSQFVEHSSVRTAKYDNISVSIWAKSPQECKSVNPAQYSFVNGRMMRDKLIQHAIRQAYADTLHPEQQPEYVLFVDLPATDVDVNVHPAKHEVRFHHARLLHDLIVGTIQECLADFNKSLPIETPQVTEQAPPAWLAHSNVNVTASSDKPSFNRSELKPLNRPDPIKSFSGLTPVSLSNVSAEFDKAPSIENSTFTIIKVQSQIVMVEHQSKIWLISLAELFDVNTVAKLSDTQLQPAPLLVPIRIKINEDEIKQVEEGKRQLHDCGFDVKLHQSFLIIKQVPSIIRSRDCSRFLPDFFNALFSCGGWTKNSIVKLISESNDIPSDNQNILKQLHILKGHADFDKQWNKIAKVIDLSNIYHLI